MRISAVVILALSFQSCSMLNPLDAILPKPSIDVTAQVAEVATSDKSVLKIETGTTTQKADVISNDTTYKANTIQNITNSLTWWQMLLIVVLASGALPSYKEMYQAIVYVTKDMFKAVIYPFRALGVFILEFKRVGDNNGDA